MCSFAGPVYVSATYAYRPQFSIIVNLFGEETANKWNLYQFPKGIPTNCFLQNDGFILAAERMPLFIFSVAIGLSFLSGLISVYNRRSARKLSFSIVAWICLSFLLDFQRVILWPQATELDVALTRHVWYYPLFAIQSVAFVVLTAFIIPVLFGRATAGLANKVSGQLRRR